MNSVDKYFQKSPRTASRVVDGEAVVVVPGEGIVYVLNKVGSRIWELSDGTRRLKEIAQAISDEFDISQKEAEKDTMDFIEELMRNGILVSK